MKHALTKARLTRIMHWARKRYRKILVHIGHFQKRCHLMVVSLVENLLAASRACEDFVMPMYNPGFMSYLPNKRDSVEC